MRGQPERARRLVVDVPAIVADALADRVGDTSTRALSEAVAASTAASLGLDPLPTARERRNARRRAAYAASKGVVDTDA